MSIIYNNSMEKEEVLIEEKIEEEVSALSEIIVSPKNYEWINEECLVAIINANEDFFNFSNLEVCGKSILEWVVLATIGPKQIILDDKSDEELLIDLKKSVGDKKFVFVAYSDTPFLQRRTFCKILDYFSTNNMNALKLDRGYVFKTDYLKTLQSFESVIKKSFEPSDFERVNNPRSLTKFFEFMNNKIRFFHKKNNVVMFGEETIFIDSDVEIEAGTIIYPNNVLKGQTSIGKSTILKSGNVIIDSILGDNVVAEGNYIFSSKINSNKILKPLSKIENLEV